MGEHDEARRLPDASGLVRDPPARERYGIQAAQELLANLDVRTTMIYTQVMNSGAMAVRNPVDRL